LDTFIANYGADGAPLWGKTVGGWYYDFGNGVLSEAGDVIVVGRCPEDCVFAEDEPNEITVDVDAFSSDDFIAKYRADGAFVWTQFGDWIRQPTAILTQAGTVMLTGASVTADRLGDAPILASAGRDVFLAELDSDGTLAWAKPGDEAYTIVGVDIVYLNEENAVVVIGRFKGAVTFGAGEPNETVLSSHGFFDVFVAKYMI
jgi:hypothetical protein